MGGSNSGISGMGKAPMAAREHKKEPVGRTSVGKREEEVKYGTNQFLAVVGGRYYRRNVRQHSVAAMEN